MRTTLLITLFLLSIKICYPIDKQKVSNVKHVQTINKAPVIQSNNHVDSTVLKVLREIGNNTAPPQLFGKNLLEISIYLSIVVPIVLILWFRFNRKQILSGSYYQEIAGRYAGFTETRYPQIEKDRNGKIYSGIIMDILEVDSNGSFRGEFKYGENLTTSQERSVKFELLDEGIYTFLGKLNHRFSFPMRRHPYRPSENRTYHGKLFIVHRLDFSYEQYKFEEYVKYEYDITHYRDMKSLKFTICQKYNNSELILPPSFSLDRHFGLTFEPSGSVELCVFGRK